MFSDSVDPIRLVMSFPKFFLVDYESVVGS